MADLPQLPERARRKLALRWQALIEKHGFTGEHLKWAETRKRKISTRALLPPASIDSPAVRFMQARSAPTEPVYAHPDTIGIQETGMLAAERYGQFIDEYFSLWLSEQGRCSDAFTAWLLELRVVVADEAAQLWKERGDWFDRVSRPSLDTVLTPLFDQSKTKARDIEIADLEPENVPFERLMAQAHEALERSSRAVQGIGKEPDEHPQSALPGTNEATPDVAAPRFSGTITSRDAVERMDAYIVGRGLGLTEFACQAGTTDRTLRSFRKTATVRRDIFDGIAKAMGLTREELLHGKASGK
jgi:hypothetical protein